MDEGKRIEMSFGFAADGAKQIVTLAVAIITLTATLAKDIFSTVSTEAKYALIASWVFYALSVLAGMATIFALTGELQPKSPPRPAKEPSIRDSSPGTYGGAMIILFLIAIVCTILFGIASIFSKG
jgi:hypothetical protein